ncbi:hypothetical protein RA955_05855 [Geobacillus proteiniphilus]|uniref:Adenine deaminase n=1 Tax=Geobacillus proteiniphilus TaxID=860353 RepID=A0A1Q5T2B6_9BACL|nr:hypothetical protein [Geobacillus proteiniphilus]OKO94265.1 Adenine deaminase [Geobacillus proteiniphilus]WMJ17586.1 hypothetical protein RA955_05855 [Geobacillus proteiniphilus]
MRSFIGNDRCPAVRQLAFLPCCAVGDSSQKVAEACTKTERLEPLERATVGLYDVKRGEVVLPAERLEEKVAK